jgi:hypothetical protein
MSSSAAGADGDGCMPRDYIDGMQVQHAAIRNLLALQESVLQSVVRGRPRVNSPKHMLQFTSDHLSILLTEMRLSVEVVCPELS